MKKVIGLGHIARVGKDEAARRLVEGHGFVRLSTADMIREFCYELNPIVSDIHEPHVRYQDAVDHLGDAAKDKVAEVRRIQQEVGRIVRSLYGDDFWIERLSDKIEETDADVVVPDVRFENEVLMIVQFHSGYVARLDRPGFEPLDHITDQALVGWDGWDFIIDNDADLAQLHGRVDIMLDIINGDVDVFDTINVAEWVRERGLL